MKNISKDVALIALQQPEAKHFICPIKTMKLLTQSGRVVRDQCLSYLLMIYIYTCVQIFQSHCVPVYGG